ncbi:MAG TPA: PRC-barrel domain-containing protein [Longimicrobiales bacterium]|nr:PRC-barrel domain-containing protein [Longimicrobiales bacterium]
MPLIPLSRFGDSARPGTFDVRGWDVKTELDNEKVGEVDDMLLDDSGRPRYLDIDLGLFRKHVLMPIGQARADGRKDVVWVPGMTKDQFKHIPEYEHDVARIDRDYEDRLAGAYAGVGRRPARDDEAGETRETLPELATLDELDGYRIASGDANPKGWDVVAADGREIGEVDELIVDTEAMKVRYLDVDLDSDKLGFGDRDRHVLIPIGYATLDRDDKKVIVDVVTSTDVGDLPVYGGLPLPRDFERGMQDAFQRGHAAGDRYSRPVYDADRFWGERRAATGVVPDTGNLLDATSRDREFDPGRTHVHDDIDDAADRMAAGPRDLPETTIDQGVDDISTRVGNDQEIRIRVRGDEIIVERKKIE